VNPPDPMAENTPWSFRAFCMVTGIIHFTSELAPAVYNLTFCLYYAIKIRNTLKSNQLDHSAWERDKMCVHVVSIIIIIIPVVIFSAEKDIGISALGI
jgi:hypothetical protein